MISIYIPNIKTLIWGIRIIIVFMSVSYQAIKAAFMQTFPFKSGEVRLFVLAYNLGNFLRRLVLPGKIKHWSLRTLLVKLIKIGAKVLRHSLYVIFQMAKVAISKEMFFEIISRINRLRCCLQQ